MSDAKIEGEIQAPVAEKLEPISGSFSRDNFRANARLELMRASLEGHPKFDKFSDFRNLLKEQDKPYIIAA